MYNNVHYYICHNLNKRLYMKNNLSKLFLHCENEQDIEIFGTNLV